MFALLSRFSTLDDKGSILAVDNRTGEQEVERTYRTRPTQRPPSSTMPGMIPNKPDDCNGRRPSLFTHRAGKKHPRLSHPLAHCPFQQASQASARTNTASSAALPPARAFLAHHAPHQDIGARLARQQHRLPALGARGGGGRRGEAGDGGYEGRQRRGGRGADD